MKCQCIDCKAEYVVKHERCPKCRSRHIIVVEDDHSADEGKQSKQKQPETQAKLKEGDIIKVNETVALVKMEAGGYYRLLAIKRDYYEECYCLSRCDGNGEIENVGTLEIPARSLDYWLDTDSIEITVPLRGNKQ